MHTHSPPSLSSLAAPLESTRLADATWTEASFLLNEQTLLLLPVGSTEAHGPHLPLQTDVIIAEGMARRACERLLERGAQALVLPSLPYGVTEFARGFNGTLGIPGAVLKALLFALLEAIFRQGGRTVILINAHLEPAHLGVLREVAKEGETHSGVRVLFPDKTRRRWVQTLPEEFQKGECHAGCYETSLVLAETPNCVRDVHALALPPVPINLTAAMQAGASSFEEAGASEAYFGNPQAASREEGDAIYEQLTRMILTTVEEAGLLPRA